MKYRPASCFPLDSGLGNFHNEFEDVGRPRRLADLCFDDLPQGLENNLVRDTDHSVEPGSSATAP